MNMSGIDPIGPIPFRAPAPASPHAPHPAPAAAPGERAAPGSPISRIVGGLVPGRIDFSSGDTPRPGTLPLYRHPADTNAAATGVHAGRLLDTEA